MSHLQHGAESAFNDRVSQTMTDMKEGDTASPAVLENACGEGLLLQKGEAPPEPRGSMSSP